MEAVCAQGSAGRAGAIYPRPDEFGSAARVISSQRCRGAATTRPGDAGAVREAARASRTLGSAGTPGTGLPTADGRAPITATSCGAVPVRDSAGAGNGSGESAGRWCLRQAAPVQLPPPTQADKATFNFDWANGLFFKTADGKFSFHAGATIHYDAAWYSASPLLQFGPGGINDGVNLRRGRIFMEGTLYDAADYKFELEFVNGLGFPPVGTTGAVQVTSVTNAPGPTMRGSRSRTCLLGNVWLGSQKEWFSLEHLNNYKYLEFMERPYLFDFSQPTAFNNGFTPGISAFRTWANDRIFTAISGYKNDSDLLGFGIGDGQYAVTGRVAALPVWMPNDKVFWHVGGAMSHRDAVNGQVQIRLRDNVRAAPFPLLNLVANTGPINASSQDLYNLETAAVSGGVHGQRHQRCFSRPRPRPG